MSKDSPEKRNLLASVPDFTRGGFSFNYVKRGVHLLSRHALTLFLLPVAATLLLELGAMARTGELSNMWNVARQTDLQFNMVTFLACCLLLTVVALTYIFTRVRPCYLLDYHCYAPPDRMKMSVAQFMDLSRNSGAFDERSLDFQEKIITRSGLGEETYLPDALHMHPPQITMQAARQEAELVMFESIERVLRQCKLRPRQVQILIVNCSLFNPTPSLSAMIVNHFKMASNTITYNLSGMGCSAGLIAVSLARELLQVYANSTALVISTENITQNWYFGNDRSMLIPNCLFRVGCAAMVLTNKRGARRRAKYELLHLVRTHMGNQDKSYGCVFQQEDDKGNTGVYLSKDLMTIAGHALKANITTLAPLVLPITEQLRFVLNLLGRKVLRIKGMRPYLPDFSRAFDHVVIHTGGRGVVEEIEKQLQLSQQRMQPSKDTLYRFGNTSSSSIWYVLANIETTQTVHRGDRVWMISFGSGFKCNSAIWRALRTVRTQHSCWTGQRHELTNGHK